MSPKFTIKRYQFDLDFKAQESMIVLIINDDKIIVTFNTYCYYNI